MNTGTQAILWVSVPLEVRIERAGSRKVYVSARKVRWTLGDGQQAEGSYKPSAAAFVEAYRPGLAKAEISPMRHVKNNE